VLSYKFRIYPSKAVQARLNEQLELCRWLYNRLLFELNKTREEGIMLKQIEGNVKGVIVKREKSGKWYAVVQVEDEPKPLPKTGKSVGIDVGVKHFLTDSEGRQIENPRFYEKTLKKIKILQHILSRKQKSSNNREKTRTKLAKAYERLVNQRDDFLHKLSRYYVNNYDTIAVEDLQIQNMVRNHNLAQRILDASWGKFIQLLLYKAERAGKEVVRVSRSYTPAASALRASTNPRGTSKGLTFDNQYRDWISACRIKNRAGLGQSSGPVERRPLLCAISAMEIITGQVFSTKQEAPCESWG